MSWHGTCNAILLSVILMSAGRFLFGIFTTDANVVEIGLSMMQIISPTYFLFVFIEVYSGALRAQGHVIVTTAMTMIGICVLRVVWVTWIVPDGTLSQIVACYPNYMAGQRGGDDHLLSL